MSYTLFLRIALPVIAVPALLVFLLPERVVPAYLDVIQPLALGTGAVLALVTSRNYRSHLRNAFISLSAFLFLFMLAVVFLLSSAPVAVPYIREHLGDVELLRIAQSTQFITFAMLYLFCLSVLRAVDVKRLNRNGWIMLALTSIASLSVVIYPNMEAIQHISTAGPFEVGGLVIRFLDAFTAIIVAPVLWLYVQDRKSHHRQSLTFVVVVLGVLVLLFIDHLFESIATLFPGMVSVGSSLYYAVHQAIWVYGYLMIAVGLYAHRKQDQWGYNIVDRVMAGELELAEEA